MEKKNDLGKVTTEQEKKAQADKLPFYKNWRFYVYTLIALCLSFLAISSLLNGCAIREVQKQEQEKTSIRLDDVREPHSLFIGSTRYFAPGDYSATIPNGVNFNLNSAQSGFLPSAGQSVINLSLYSGSGTSVGYSRLSNSCASPLYSAGYTNWETGYPCYHYGVDTTYTQYPKGVSTTFTTGYVFIVPGVAYSTNGSTAYFKAYTPNDISVANYSQYWDWFTDSNQTYAWFKWKGLPSGTSSRGLTFSLTISNNSNDAYSSGYEDGYSSGVSDGFSLGFNEGSSTGYEEGYSTGYNDGYDTGMSEGYSDGYSTGYSEGFSTAYEPGWSAGFSSAMQFVDTTFIKGSEIRGLRLVQMEGTSQDDYEALFSALYYGGSSDLVDVYFTNGDWLKRLKTVDDEQNLITIEAQYIHNGLNGGPKTLAYASRQGTAGNYTYYGYVADVFGGSDWGTFAYLLDSVTSPFDDGGYDVLIRSDDIDLSYVFPVYYTSWQAGYEAGSSDGYIDGYASGSSIGYINGRNAAEPSALTETLVVVFQQPFNQIYRFLNFNVLGLNLLALSCGIITLFIVVKVVKKII